MRRTLEFAVAFVLLAGSLLASGDDAKKLSQQLASKDVAKVQAALEGLGELRRGGVPALVQALGDSRRWVRAGALGQLAKLGELASEALPKIVEHGAALGTADDATLATALFHAMSMTGLDGRIVPVGRPIDEPGMDPQDIDAAEREVECSAAVLAIARIGASARLGLLDLVSRTPRGEARSDFTLPRIALAVAFREEAERLRSANDPEELDELAGVVAQGTRSQSLEARLTALVAAAAFQRTTKLLDEPLERALGSPEARERALAAATLAQNGAECERSGPKLQALFSDPSSYVRIFAAAAARKSCGASAESENVLIAALGDPDAETRLAAVELLNSNGFRPPTRAAAALGECLKSKDERLLVAACGALAVIGPGAVETAPKVSALFKHKRFAVRQAASRALDRVR